MSLRDRLLQRATGLAEGGVTLVSDYVATRELGPKLGALLDVKDDLPSSLHELLLKLVDVVRDDEEPGATPASSASASATSASRWR